MLGFNKIEKNILYILPRKFAHSIIYWKHHKSRLNWNNPQLFDEKIHWLSVNVYDEKYGKYADKYGVRSYVKQCGFEKLLIPLIEVFNNSKEINYEDLPNQFILKATHGSGTNFYIICEDKSKLDVYKVNRIMKKALKGNFAKQQCEYHYKGIIPKIICENLLKNDQNKRLIDYKVFCFSGKAKYVMVCTDRSNEKEYHLLSMYTTEWKQINYVKKEYQSRQIIEKPACLNQMLEAADILSTPFPLARIDFYIVNGQLYFGEITLTPGGGFSRLNEKGQNELGNMLVLPKL